MNRFEDSLRSILDAQTFWFPVVGEVVSFDATKQTADVRPVVSLDGEDAPVVKDVPVSMPAGGGWYIGFNLSAGDKVLLVFCGHLASLWMTGSNAEREMQRPELHNAIAIPAFARTTGKTFSGLLLSNDAGSVKIEMTGTGVKVTGNLEVTGLVDATAITPATKVSVSTHTHSGVTAGSSVSGPPTPGS